MKKTLLASALALALISTVSVAADTTSTASSPVDNQHLQGLYIGGGLGMMHYHDESSDPIFGDDSDSGNASNITGFAGYQFNSYFALEAGAQVLTSEGTSILNGYAAAKGILPLNNQFDLYGKLGVSIQPITSPLFGVGADYKIDSHWSVGPEYLLVLSNANDLLGGEEKSNASFYTIQVSYTF